MDEYLKRATLLKHRESYCEYDDDVEVVCGKCTHGKLFCSKCSEYKPGNRRYDDGKWKAAN